MKVMCEAPTLEALCATGHRHTTSVAQQDGLSTESTWTGCGKRRQAGEPHDVFNRITDREKNASRVCSLIQCQDRMVQVEHPAQENTAWLAQSSRGGENRPRLDTKWIVLG